jgi:hypothetical protein
MTSNKSWLGANMCPSRQPNRVRKWMAISQTIGVGLNPGSNREL